MKGLRNSKCVIEKQMLTYEHKKTTISSYPCKTMIVCEWKNHQYTRSMKNSIE